MENTRWAYCAHEAVHSNLQAPVKWASLWVGLRCLFAAVPAQGRAAGVMSGIAFLKGTDDMRPRTCVNAALRALECKSPLLLHSHLGGRRQQKLSGSA